MPELPEVETLHRQLNKVISGAKILGAKVVDIKLGAMEYLVGRDVSFLYRKGKGLHIMLDDGTAITIHLRMTGRMLWQEDQPRQFPHTRLMIYFYHGRLDLIDPRRFATVTMQRVGTDYTKERDDGVYFSPRGCFERGKNRSLPIKSFLMDQHVISGIGNIYACEILYGACISPIRKTQDVSFADWKKIYRVAKAVLTKAIACRGTTVSDWSDLYGQPGEYQHYLNVYSKAGFPCPRCGVLIARCKLAGRGTYYCPACQQ